MKKIFLKSSIQIFLGSCLVLALFVFFEPSILKGAEDTFTISQSITSEVSFSTPATDVTLSPSLGGLTGGTSNGGTQVVVTTNNALGYTMTITASSSNGMLGNSNPSNTIPAYVTATPGLPDYSFTVPANKAYFGYTVEASTTGDLATSFQDDSSDCGAGSSDAVGQCWIGATSTAYTIVNRTSETPVSGSTTTLKFRVQIQPNPSPAIPNDTYVATTTLTATAN